MQKIIAYLTDQDEDGEVYHVPQTGRTYQIEKRMGGRYNLRCMGENVFVHGGSFESCRIQFEKMFEVMR